MPAVSRRALILLAVLFALPAYAACGGDDDGGSEAPTFSQADQVLEAGKSYTATLKTSKGDIVVDLFADTAPNTVNSFVFLAQKGFFDGITFHRVVEGFVIQTGDPSGAGSGGPGYETADEPSEARNSRGTLAMAKAPGAGEFGSQFFINLADNDDLDFDNPTKDKFYPFGEVISGMEVVDAIGAAPVDNRDRPDPPITLTTVTIEAK